MKFYFYGKSWSENISITERIYKYFEKNGKNIIYCDGGDGIQMYLVVK